MMQHRPPMRKTTIQAFILTIVTELLHGVAVPRLVAYGFLLVITIIFLRGGIVGGAQMLWLKVSGRGER